MAASLASRYSRGERELCSTEAAVMSVRVSRTGVSALMNPPVIRAALVGQVLTAAVDAQPPQGYDVDDYDHQRPEGVRQDEEHLVDEVDGTRSAREQLGLGRGELVVAQDALLVQRG